MKSEEINPVISVIMPTYNAERYVGKAMESILQQSFCDFEFIIIDDCSTDESYKIIESYATHDKRIRLFRNNENKKLPYTLNFGISQASGKYIARMDADDVSYPDRFSKQFEFMENNPDVGVCGTMIDVFDEKMKIKLYTPAAPSSHEAIKINLHLIYCVISHPTTFIKSDLFKIGYCYNTLLADNAEDHDLWLRMIDSGVKFANIPDSLLAYRSSPTQSSRLNSIAINQWRKEKLNIYLTNLLKNQLTHQDVENHFKLLLAPKSRWSIFDLFKYTPYLNKLKEANDIKCIYDKKEFELFISNLSLMGKLLPKTTYLIQSMKSYFSLSIT